jgi:NTE family protein
MTEPLTASPAGIIQKADAFKWDGKSLEAGIALALSGGGFRAMLFHAGALMRLNEFGILPRVARISSVSGGSIAAGYLACVWTKLGSTNAVGAFEKFQDTYVEPILSFGRQKIDVSDILTGFLPWTSAAGQVAASYDKYLLNNITHE